MRLVRAAIAVYLAGGVAVWISFVRTNPDGLANVGLMLYVAPVTALGMALGKLTGSNEFPLIPSSFGYIAGHAVFFFPSLLAIACLIGWATGAVARRWRAKT